MKIFFFIHHLGNGGAERVTSVLANELSARGMEVIIGLYDYNKNTYDLQSEIKIVEIPNLSGLFRRFKKYYYLRKTISEIKPNVIIAVMPYNFVAIKISSIGLGIPIIVSDHANFQWNANKILKFIRYNVYKLADKVTVLSHNDEQFMSSRLHNMKVMYNPLSFPLLTEKTERKKNILACGRVSIWDVKGFDLLIRMWGHLAHEYQDWTLDIAGDGSNDDFTHLKILAQQCGVEDRVNFLGFCKNIKDIMAHSSIFALPSREEGFPCSLLEAMSQGCSPVAFSIHNIISEIITDGEDGYIVPDGDLITFENRLALLMDSEDVRNKISKKTIESVKRFSVSEIGDEWESFLKKIVNK